MLLTTTFTGADERRSTIIIRKQTLEVKEGHVGTADLKVTADLIHDFRDLTGMTPTAYHPSSPQRRNHVPLAAPTLCCRTSCIRTLPRLLPE